MNAANIPSREADLKICERIRKERRDREISASAKWFDNYARAYEVESLPACYAYNPFPR